MEKMSILIRCDGSPEIGIGHVMRCLALADEIHAQNCNICFAMRKGPLGIQMVQEKGFKVITSDETCQVFDYGEWLNGCVRKADARAIVFDVRDGLSRTVVKELRNNGILIVTIDDPEDKRLEADLAFYPPVPQVKRMNWTGFTGKLYAGWEWVILRPEFAAWRKKQDGISPPPLTRYPSSPRILVTTGGSDPAGLILKALQALNMLSADFHAMIVLGPGFVHHDSLKELLCHAEYKYTILENVTDMVSVMAQADMAIASFGVTAYELAVMGVPSIYLCLTEDHAESASAFTSAGIALSFGIHHNVDSLAIYQNIRNLFYKKDDQIAMTRQATNKVDGQGSERIAGIIASRCTVLQ